VRLFADSFILLARVFTALASILKRIWLVAYTLPTFNLNVNIWQWGSDVANPADATCVGCLVGGHHGVVSLGPINPGNLAQVQFSLKTSGQMMCLLVPKGTDLRPPPVTLSQWGSCVEVPAGTLRYYAVIQVDDIGRGFANEHRFALLVPLTGAVQGIFSTSWNQPADWPTPIP
jgi:hypothetical protein